MLTPHNLRVEYKRNPIGMDERSPRFFYQLAGDSKYQRAYRIQVVDGYSNTQMWDSGWIEDDRTHQIEYAGKPLKPFTRYNWQVQARDESGAESPWSTEEAFFETGYLNTPWHGIWLAGLARLGAQFFREFKIEKKVARARLYSTALGTYSIFLNGQPIGEEDCLKPGWTDYFTRVQYQAYDVAALLTPGEHVLATELADGWFFLRNYDAGKCTGFRAELLLVYEDGTEEWICTDQKWKCFSEVVYNPLRSSTIYNGEIYEKWEETDWKLPGGFREHTRNAWELTKEHIPYIDQVHIVWQSGPAIRRKHLMHPKSITRRPNATWLVDFGQNFAGWERITLENTMQGTTIVIKHGEMLNADGSLYIQNLRSAWARTVYTTGTHPQEVYEPKHTFYGFRYLEISGWPGELTPENIQAYAVYSDLEETGAFSCSEPLLNQLYSNILWGQRSNFLDVPTDCPQRDERLGWTADTQVFTNIATYNMECGAFYTKWLADLDVARYRDGAYAGITPRTTDLFQENISGATGWADAAIICPFIMLAKYGDSRIIRQYYPAMVRWLDWQVDHAQGNYIVKNALFGDWLNHDAPISEEYLSSAYLAGMAHMLSQMGKNIGANHEALRMEQLSLAVKAAMAQRFFTPEGELLEKSQTAALLALHFHLCPSQEAHQKTLDALVTDIVVNRKLHLSTGFLGTPLLLRTLTDNGKADLAYQLLLQTTFPSWLYPVTQGATTMWERWNSWTETDGFGDPGMNSFNHYAYGAVGEWFFEVICGIRPLIHDFQVTTPGFKHFALAPIPSHRLQHANAKYRSLYGEIASQWQWQEDAQSLRWEFTVPVNTTATVHIPTGFTLAATPLPEGLTPAEDGKFTAEPGSYTLLLQECAQ